MSGEVVERTRPEEGAGVRLSQPDPIGAWLDVLMPMLRLGAAERRSIRDELDSHLRDRVRDLMLSGLDETRAAGEAIGELGDAAELASRYGQASRGPARRRLLMNVGLLGMASAALVTSMVAVMQPAAGPGSGGDASGAAVRVYAPPASGVGAAGGDIRIGAVRYEATPLQDVLEDIATKAGLELVVRWSELAPWRPTETRATFAAGERSLAEMFTTLNYRLPYEPGEYREIIDFRVNNGTLEVASANYFNRKEGVLAVMDIGGILESGVDAEELTNAITMFVEPEQWVDNGGGAAAYAVVGTRLMVKAPPRMIEGVRWILGQFEEGEGAGVDEARGEAAHERTAEAIGPANGVKAAHANRPGPLSMQIEARHFALNRTAAADMASAVERALGIAPGMRQSPMGRTIFKSETENRVTVRATHGEVEWIAKLVRELESEGPLADRAVRETREMRLRSARAAEVREFLGSALDINPVLKQCMVERVFEVDASENTLTVTATPWQVDVIERIAMLLDM